MFLTTGQQFWLITFTLIATYVAARVTNNAAKRLDFLNATRTPVPYPLPQQQQMIPPEQQQVVPYWTPDGRQVAPPPQFQQHYAQQQPAPQPPPPPPEPRDFSMQLPKVFIGMWLVVEVPLLLVLAVIAHSSY